MEKLRYQHDEDDGLKFAVYVGIAICDKEFDSPVLQVYAPSILPFMGLADKEIAATRVRSQPEILQMNGSVSKDEVSVKNYIEAVYFGLHTNRELPPDVRKGEQVLLLRIQNTDTYFWISLGRDDNLRRGERWKVRVSDDMKFQKDLDDDNTYWMELDTLLNKHIWLQTSDSDGEKYIYTIKIDAVKNTVLICDNARNEWLLESDKNRILSRNGDGSFVDIYGPDVHVHAVRQLMWSAYELIIDVRRETRSASRTNMNRIPDKGTCKQFRNSLTRGKDSVGWDFTESTKRKEGGVDATYMRHNYL